MIGHRKTQEMADSNKSVKSIEKTVQPHLGRLDSRRLTRSEIYQAFTILISDE